jgi:hypothetical protein
VEFIVTQTAEMRFMKGVSGYRSFAQVGNEGIRNKLMVDSHIDID